MDVSLEFLELHFLCSTLLDDEFDLKSQKVRFMFPSFTFPVLWPCPHLAQLLYQGLAGL